MLMSVACASSRRYFEAFFAANPLTLIKHYKIIGTNSNDETFAIEENASRQRFVTHNVDLTVKTLEFIPLETYGCEEMRVFRFEFE